ncbi:MAG TPA: pilus assembly protein PilM [Opitutaceae bacterium]
MRSPRVLAVDIGAGHVACGAFSVGATGRLVLQHFAIEPHSSDPTHEARWAIEIAQSLGAVSARHKLGGPSAIAVPGHLALTKFIKTPSLAKEKRSKIVAFEAAENIPHPLEEVVWDHLVVSDDGFDLEVMLTASKFDAMQTLCSAADKADFPVERAKPAGLALYHAFRYNYPECKENVIVVDIGARSTNLLFLAERLNSPDFGGYAKNAAPGSRHAVEGDRFYIRTLPLAGNAITQMIAEELKIDFPSAELLKIQVLTGQTDLPLNSPSRAVVHRAAELFAQKLQLEIVRSSVNYRRQSGTGAATVVYLTGGGSLMPELGDVLADKLKVRVERYQSFKNVDVSGDARVSGAEKHAAVLGPLVGLATRLVVKDETEASLLPPSLQAALAFRKRQPVLVLAAALGTVALLPPIAYFHSKVTEIEQQISRVDDQLMPLRSVLNRNEQNTAQIGEAKKQIEALRGAYDTKANWINFFAELQDRLVKIEDVWLDRVQVERPEPLDPAAAEAAAAEAAAQAQAQPPAPDGSQPQPDPNAPPPAPPVRMKLSGRLLDVSNPQSRVSPEATERVRKLLASFKGSPFIQAVEKERFDNSQNGLLRFDFELVINPRKSL